MRAARAAIGAILLGALSSCVKPTKTDPNETGPSRTPIFGGPGWTVIPSEHFIADGVQGTRTFAHGAVETAPFDSLVLSWNLLGPAPMGGAFRVQVRVAGEWWPREKGRTMAIASEGKLGSVRQPDDEMTHVEIDTFLVKGPRPADAFRLSADLPEGSFIHSMGAAHYLAAAKSARVVDTARSAAWGMTLDVKPRSQLSEDPKIASRICSPTSTAMALEYLGSPIPTKDFAARVYDPSAELYGNWSINAARAGELVGEAFVAHFDTFAEIEREIEAGRPVVLSHSWSAGELTGAPIASSKGHLIVVVGFTRDGDVVVNDPAAKPNEVRRVYPRRELFHTWQHNGNGIVYVFRPGPH